MLELFNWSILPVNLPYTVLLCLMTLYWMLYILGFIGSETLDFLNLEMDTDVDIDVDTGVDVGVDHDVGLDFQHDIGADVGVDHDVGAGLHHHLEADVDLDADVGGHGLSGWITTLHFFHLGVVPVMVIMSILIVTMWAISVLTTYYTTITGMWFFLVLFVPNFMVGMLVTRTILRPFVPLLKKMFDQTGDHVEVIGKMCVVTSLEVTPKYGQVEYATSGAPIVLNAITKEGETLKKGDEAVIYKYEDEKNRYLITKMK